MGSEARLAYKTPLVLSRIAAQAEEPARTAALVLGHMRGLPPGGRDALLGLTPDDIEVDPMTGVVSLAFPNGKRAALDAAGAQYLLAYLRSFLRRIPSPWLWPSPMDPTEHINLRTIERTLTRATRPD
jgi:hypothetical protein